MLESELKKIAERREKVTQQRLSYTLEVVRKGIDSREDGCVWLMREIAKLGGQVTEELLPDFIDISTRETIKHKFVIYQRVMDLKEKNKFQMEFYKLLTNGESLLENVQRKIFNRNQKIQPNPMLEFIGEMNSISILRRPKFSALTQGRPESMTNYYDNLSFVDNIQQDRLESAFRQSMVDEKAFLTDVQVAGQQQENVQSDNIGLENESQRVISGIDRLKEQEISVIGEEEPSRKDQSELNKKFHSKERASARVNYVTVSENPQEKYPLGKLSRVPVSANHRLQLISARSNFSVAESPIVKRKMAEFSQRGVVFIGDENYPFDNAHLYGVYAVPEATQISNELISKTIRRKDSRLVSKYSSQTLNNLPLSRASSVLASASLPSLKRERSQTSSKLTYSSSGPNINPEDEGEDDPFNTHILFFEGETLINSFGSKEELIRQQRDVNNQISMFEATIDLLEHKEMNRVFDIYSVSQRNLENLESKGIKPTNRMLKMKRSTTALIPHFEEKPVGAYEVDILLYLSTTMGFINAASRLKSKAQELEKEKIIGKQQPNKKYWAG